MSASPLHEITVTCTDDLPTATTTVIQTVYPSAVTVTQTVYDMWTPEGTGMSTVSASTGIGYTPTYTTDQSGPVKTHSVIVGGLDSTGTPILRYNPESVSGEIGDKIEFNFLANNHTVTQADFDSPCFPKANGFGSGFRPNMVSAVIGSVVGIQVLTGVDECGGTGDGVVYDYRSGSTVVLLCADGGGEAALSGWDGVCGECGRVWR